MSAMYVSARVDYALRALVAMARSEGPMTAAALAGDQDLPVNYLEAILLDLRRAGLVLSRRGPDAGYRFTVAPDQITVADVMRVLEGPLAEVRGLRPEATSYSESTSAIRDVWVALRASLRQVLEEVSIAQLATGQLPDPVARLVQDPEAWKPH